MNIYITLVSLCIVIFNVPDACSSYLCPILCPLTVIACPFINETDCEMRDGKVYGCCCSTCVISQGGDCSPPDIPTPQMCEVGTTCVNGTCICEPSTTTAT